MRVRLMLPFVGCLMLLLVGWQVAGVIAQGPDSAGRPLAGCVAGGSYDPACDVNHDGEITVEDIQLTAGHWGATGVYQADGWGLTGNSGTTPSNFIGTTDNMSLTLRVSNTVGLRLEPTEGAPNLIGGHESNFVSSASTGAMIGGGKRNLITGTHNLASVIGGGIDNRAEGDIVSIGGGAANMVTGSVSVIGGGYVNTIVGERSTISGGSENMIRSSFANLGGGQGNQITGDYSTIGGGFYNRETARAATIGGGLYNENHGEYSTIGGGLYNIAAGSSAIIVGGYLNYALGDFSLAGGHGARAYTDGTWVWADASTYGGISFPVITETSIITTNPNQFLVRALGGTTFVSGIDLDDGTIQTGVHLAPSSGSWSSLSDAASKTGITPVDSQAILEGLLALPISSWRYRGQPETVRHMGPMAQDFYAAFGLGEDARYISTVDADGVALAATQALAHEVKGTQAEITALQNDNAALQAQVAALQSDNAALQAQVAEMLGRLREIESGLKK